MKVVVLSFNHPDLTERTVRSVCETVHTSDVILIHNGSLPQHQTRLQTTFPEIEHVLLPKNKGFPGGANAGLQTAFTQTDWVLFLTNDCQLKAWKKPTTKPALIAPLIWGRKESRVDSIGAKFDPENAHLSHCKSTGEFKDQTKSPYVPGTAFWIHREVFEAVQGFDESLEMFWEDVDFSVRAKQSGFPLLADEDTKILHAIGKTTHKDSHYTTFLFQRNRKRVSLKYSSRKWQTYAVLWQSWTKSLWFHFRKRHWDRLELLWKAIRA